MEDFKVKYDNLKKDTDVLIKKYRGEINDLKIEVERFKKWYHNERQQKESMERLYDNNLNELNKFKYE
jgi:hypothetical protein